MGNSVSNINNTVLGQSLLNKTFITKTKFTLSGNNVLYLSEYEDGKLPYEYEHIMITLEPGFKFTVKEVLYHNYRFSSTFIRITIIPEPTHEKLIQKNKNMSMKIVEYKDLEPNYTFYEYIIPQLHTNFVLSMNNKYLETNNPNDLQYFKNYINTKIGVGMNSFTEEWLCMDHNKKVIFDKNIVEVL